VHLWRRRQKLLFNSGLIENPFVMAVHYIFFKKSVHLYAKIKALCIKPIKEEYYPSTITGLSQDGPW